MLDTHSTNFHVQIYTTDSTTLPFINETESNSQNVRTKVQQVIDALHLSASLNKAWQEKASVYTLANGEVRVSVEP